MGYVPVFAIGALLAAGTGLAAQQAGVIQRSLAQGPQTIGAARGYNALTSSVIHGSAVNADRTPLPNASVRLRNLETHQIEQVAVADRTGQFTFIAQPDIPYLVELADTFGRVLAVGDILTTQAGEVAGALVALPSRLPALAGLFGNTAGSVLSSAAGTGITAIEATLPQDSPRQ